MINMDKHCYTCRYFEEPFGFLEEGCKCKLTGKYISDDKCCERHEPTSQQFIDYEDDENW